MGMTGEIQRELAEKGKAWTALSLSTFLKVLLDHDLSMAREAGRALSVFVVRIDGYQGLVADLGSDALEATMGELAERLKKMLRPADTFVRSKEDCFTIIQSFPGDKLALHGTAKAMLKRLQEPMRLGWRDRCMAASIGIAFYPEDGNSADLLLEHAHLALKRTSRWGGNGFCLHSRSTARKIADDLSKHEDLRLALEAGGLSMRFQPILDLTRNCMTAVSGDILWQHSKHGCLGMADVALTAERAGLIPRLNEWLADEVCRQLRSWHDAGIDRPVSVEISRAQLLDDRFARLLSTRLRTLGVKADLLDVRLDHDLLLEETDHRMRTTLRHLADLGVTLSLSRVGEGSVAFKTLQDLPFSTLDLAPNMTAVIGRCSSSERMLRALIGFIHGLGLRVRAVGVCSGEQLSFLQRHGCDEAAGSLFAPAMDGRDIDRLTNFKPCFMQQEKPRLVPPQHLSMH